MCRIEKKMNVVRTKMEKKSRKNKQRINSRRMERAKKKKGQRNKKI